MHGNQIRFNPVLYEAELVAAHTAIAE